MQRGRVCSNTIFRNLTIIKNDELFIIIVLTITVQLVGYQLLYFVDPTIIAPNPISLSWLFLPIGSIIFGIGTVFAGGCAGGVCYRVGEGNSKSLLALLGYALGIGILAIGPLSTIFTQIDNQTMVTANGAIPTLTMFGPRIIWTVLAMVIAIFYLRRYYLLRNQKKLKITTLLPFWTPIVSGVFLGIIGILMKVDRGFSFSTIDGIGNIALSIITLQIPNWAGFFILGLIIGAFASSIQIKEFHLKSISMLEVIQFFGGGILLGIGAMLAGGCNFGHILGGIPELGISSILALPLMIAGNGIGSYILYIRFNQQLPASTPVKLVNA